MKEILPGLWDFDELGNIVHCYLWQWDGGFTLIDTGMPGKADTILQAMGRAGLRWQEITRILVTHADVDHCGSLVALKQATRASIACHAVEKSLLEHPERRVPAPTPVGYLLRPFHALSRLLPPVRVRPVTPDELLIDGQELAEGFTVVHTPGHTPGHISLLHPGRRLLIAGDALNNRNGRLGEPPSLFTPDIENARRSIVTLGEKYGDAFDVAVFGHGPPLHEHAGSRIAAFAAQFARPQPPHGTRTDR